MQIANLQSAKHIWVPRIVMDEDERQVGVSPTSGGPNLRDMML